MSSPYHSLRKKNKVPLFPGHMSGNRPIPFRHPDYSEDESRLLEEVTNNMVQEKLKRSPFNGLSTLPLASFASTPSLNSPRRYLDDEADGEPDIAPAPTDSELMRLMMNRVAQLEQQAKTQGEQIKTKDRQIKVLEDKLRIAEKARQESQGVQSTGAMRELETHCLLLQQQVHEMETFLAEYGMVWVGEETNDNSSVYLQEDDNEDVNESTGATPNDPGGLWRQDTSLIGGNANANVANIDFNLLVENIHDLNVLAGDGTKPIRKTCDGARFEVQESVQLTIYANGILMFDGPFRPYSEPMTRLWVKDILDGYFPSELRARYPDGVPFLVTDLRQTVFQPKNHLAFTGEGQALGGEKKPSRLIPSGYVAPSGFVEASTNASGLHVTSTPTIKPVSHTQFLDKLPQSIIRDGKVIDVRSSVGQVLTGSGDDPHGTAKPSVSVISTSVTKAMSNSMVAAATDTDTQGSRPRSYKGHGDVTTLRVVTEAGDHTYIVKMKFSETVGNLRTYLDAHRHPKVPYDIVSTFPHKLHKNNSLSLEESGLTPNAVLHLKPCKD